ncbi:MAG: hypothetical protein ACQERB_09210 [Promethearchaeati archaeon]
MQKKFIVILAISALLTAGIVTFGIYGYATAGKVENTFYYTYSSTGGEVEDININTDIGMVVINYNTTSMESYMEANINASVEGLFIEGKPFEEFYNQPVTANGSSTKTLEFSMKRDQWFNPSTWFSVRRVVINLTLRTDVVYNINVNVSLGTIVLNVPENVTIGNLGLLSSTGTVSVDLSENTKINTVDIETSTGKIELDSLKTNYTNGIDLTTSTGSIEVSLSNGIINGDINTETSTGNSYVDIFNMTYETNSVWSIRGSTGNVFLNIEQDENMNANVSSSVIVSTGRIEVIYRDWSVNVGAKFVGSTSTGIIDADLPYESLGFDSADYTYDFTLETSTGNIIFAAIE